MSELTKKTLSPKVFRAGETWGRTYERTYSLLTSPVRSKDLQGALPRIDILVFMGLSSAVCEIKQGALSPEFVSDIKFKV